MIFHVISRDHEEGNTKLHISSIKAYQYQYAGATTNGRLLCDLGGLFQIVSPFHWSDTTSICSYLSWYRFPMEIGEVETSYPISSLVLSYHFLICFHGDSNWLHWYPQWPYWILICRGILLNNELYILYLYYPQPLLTRWTYLHE